MIVSATIDHDHDPVSVVEVDERPRHQVLERLEHAREDHAGSTPP